MITRQIYQNSIIQEIKNMSLFDEKIKQKWIKIIEECSDDNFCYYVSSMKAEYAKLFWDSIEKNNGEKLKVYKTILGGLNE